MLINSARTVREVVLETPQATRIFEKFKIDYCCGGNRPLTEACAKAGVSIQEIEQMLENGTAKEFEALNFKEMRWPHRIEHIVAKHHVYTKEEMIRLEALITKVVSVHSDNHPELRQVGSLFRKLCADLKPHMFKEEQILFPFIVQLERSTTHKLGAPIAPF